MAHPECSGNARAALVKRLREDSMLEWIYYGNLDAHQMNLDMKHLGRATPASWRSLV
jgi:hypothetical protein